MGFGLCGKTIGRRRGPRLRIAGEDREVGVGLCCRRDIRIVAFPKDASESLVFVAAGTWRL